MFVLILFTGISTDITILVGLFRAFSSLELMLFIVMLETDGFLLLYDLKITNKLKPLKILIIISNLYVSPGLIDFLDGILGDS